MTNEILDDEVCSECGCLTTVVDFAAADPHEHVCLCAVCLLEALLAVVDTPHAATSNTRQIVSRLGAAATDHPPGWQSAIAMLCAGNLRRRQ
jgi:hypothetical protein